MTELDPLLDRLSSALLERLTAFHPKQFQLYGISDDGTKLQTVAAMSGAPRRENNRIICPTSAVLSPAGNHWRVEPTGEFTLPGNALGTLVEETRSGRLVLHVPLAKNGPIIVFFAENDLNTHELHRSGVVISRMDVPAITRNMRPDASGIPIERPPDDQ